MRSLAAAVALVLALASCKSRPPHPMVTVEVMGTTVNGERVASLEEALRAEPRGSIDVAISPDIEVARGADAVRAIARAGYPRMSIRSGRTATTLRFWSGEPRDVLHVERDAVTNGFVLRFERGKRIVVGDRSAAGEMIAAEWPPAPGDAPRALVVRVPDGTFREALELARWLGTQPELADASVAFEVGPPSRD